MRNVLFLIMASLAAGTIAAGDDWSDFWDRVAVERAKTAPTGSQIRPASIAEFDSGRHSGAVTPDVFDSLTWTWMRSNALKRFSSNPPAGLYLIIR